MKKAIIALSMFITLAACHANYDKTPSGLIYKIYPGKGGAKLSTAQFVKLNIEYSIKKNGKDSILSSSFGKMPQFSAIDTSTAQLRTLIWRYCQSAVLMTALFLHLV